MAALVMSAKRAAKPGIRLSDFFALITKTLAQEGRDGDRLKIGFYYSSMIIKLKDSHNFCLLDAYIAIPLGLALISFAYCRYDFFRYISNLALSFI